nr:ATP-binding protein [Yersinia pestis]
MKELLDNLDPLIRHSLPAHLTLTIEAQQPAWHAWIDVNQLENAIINLVMNARDAMEGRSGEIKIRTWNQRVERGEGRKQDMVVLEVADSGHGMTTAVKEQVFEPFFTTKQTGSGSGLGLSMVYGFVRQSGGRVQIESEPGKGTRVCLQLPRALTQSLIEVLPALGAVANMADQLVLVLEDEPDVRQTLCEQLHQLGYLTLETGDSRQALALMADVPDISIVISDLMLPGDMTGAEVLQQARSVYPHLKLLLISGQDLRRSKNFMPEVELLRKPFNQQQLVQALQRV